MAALAGLALLIFKGPYPFATSLVTGAILVCIGVALLALIGFGSSPLPFLDIFSFALVVAGAGASGLLPFQR